VLPLPVNSREADGQTPLPFAPPLRIGFVGQATEAKGIGAFLRTARALKARHGSAVEFDVIGRAAPGGLPLDAADLIAPVATDYLPRAEFTRRMAALHYVFLPLFGDYYRFAASGALIDAVSWRKPVIIGRVPLAAGWFEEFGDIGHLCADEAAMTATLDEILTNSDAVRYQHQMAALETARASRTPAALAATYGAIIARSPWGARGSPPRRPDTARPPASG
jgi:glycosyltransferase involved in cell wall biosynthesis